MTGLLAIAMVLPAAAAAAASPDGTVVVVRDSFVVGNLFIDEAAGLLALLGPPPEQGCMGEGFDDLARAQAVLTPPGNVVLRFSVTDMGVRIYEGLTFDEICDAVHSGAEPPAPLAVGTLDGRVNDNDRFAADGSANTFGSSLHGTVTLADGTPCRASLRFHAVIDPHGQVRTIQETIRLACRGQVGS